MTPNLLYFLLCWCFWTFCGFKCILHTDKKKTNSHSQLQDQDDLGLVFKDFVQRDDVRVLDLFQDVHLALDVLPRHPSSARLAAPFLDEFGGELHTCSPVSASSDHSKLTAADGREHRKRSANTIVAYFRQRKKSETADRQKDYSEVWIQSYCSRDLR